MHENLMNNFVFRGAKLKDNPKNRFINDTTAIVIATGAIRFRWQRQSSEKSSIDQYIRMDTDKWQANENDILFTIVASKKAGPFIRWMMRQGKFLSFF